jgi:hypothetical protein
MTPEQRLYKAFKNALEKEFSCHELDLIYNNNSAEYIGQLAIMALENAGEGDGKTIEDDSRIPEDFGTQVPRCRTTGE